MRRSTLVIVLWKTNAWKTCKWAIMYQYSPEENFSKTLLFFHIGPVHQSRCKSKSKTALVIAQCRNYQHFFGWEWSSTAKSSTEIFSSKILMLSEKGADYLCSCGVFTVLGALLVNNIMWTGKICVSHTQLKYSVNNINEQSDVNS